MKSLITRQRKTFKIPHSEPGDFRLGYILLPVGYMYNKAIAGAKTGDILRLFDGGSYRILSVRKISLQKIDTELLCRIRYGITLKAALMRWQINAKMEGHGEKAVSKEECLWVIYEPIGVSEKE